MTSKLFGSSGIRALANVELTPTLAAQIGQAVATFSEARKIVVGRDTRTSGPILEDAVVAGILSAGTNVLQTGVVPTPVLAFLTKALNADAGIMITASHNPPQYNGLKIFSARGMALNPKTQNDVEEVFKKRQFMMTNWACVGKSQQIDEGHRYVDILCKKVKLHRKWHVIVDPGCGATYAMASQILKNLGCKVTTLNAQPDGHFPARSPEPNAESLRPLAKIVKVSGADIGVAYDGDGDRAAFINEKGNLTDFDQTLAAYAGHVVKKKPGTVVVTSVEASMSIEKTVREHLGTVVRTKVGDVYISQTMKRHKAIFGGEPCGAWIHPQMNYCPDGILTCVLLLKALENEHLEMSRFVDQAPIYPMIRKNIVIENNRQHEIARRLESCLKTAFPEYKETSDIDGVRLVTEGGWLLARASGTEPIIRLTVEAESTMTANKIMEKAIIQVRKLVKEGVK